MNKKFFLSRNNLGIVNNIILIDGFSGTGKSLLGSILSHLPRAEQWQTDYFYEQISVINYLHKLPIQSAKALCEVKSNETIYNLFIGRNVNFRSTDISSPLSNGLKKKYTERLKKKEKTPALNEILKSDPFLILNIHYLFGYSKVLLDIFEKNLKLYILMLRDPFYLIDYWFSRELSSNRGKDKLDFGLCINVNNKLIPWYTKEYFQDFLEANNFEKSILTIYQLYKRVIKMFVNLDAKERKKMQIIFFNDYINYPEDHMKIICDKINLRRDKKFNIFLKKTINESRKIDMNEIIIDLNIFQKKYKRKISPKYQKILFELNTIYNKFYLDNKIF